MVMKNDLTKNITVISTVSCFAKELLSLLLNGFVHSSIKKKRKLMTYFRRVWNLATNTRLWHLQCRRMLSQCILAISHGGAPQKRKEAFPRSSFTPQRENIAFVVRLLDLNEHSSYLECYYWLQSRNRTLWFVISCLRFRFGAFGTLKDPCG